MAAFAGTVYEAEFPNEMRLDLATDAETFKKHLRELTTSVHNLSRQDVNERLLALLESDVCANGEELADVVKSLGRRLRIPSVYGVGFIEGSPVVGEETLEAFPRDEFGRADLYNVHLRCLVTIRRSPNSSPNSSHQGSPLTSPVTSGPLPSLAPVS
jgi:hypothetical protein